LPIFGDRPPEGRREDDPVDVERKVLMWMYREEDEDFTSGESFYWLSIGADSYTHTGYLIADANKLDVFSLDKFRDLLREGRINPRLDQRLRAPGVVFFLHLLGLDTTGHGYGPHSVVSHPGLESQADHSSPFLQEYIKNIQAVDKLVQQVEKEIEEFFQDNQTAFLFTWVSRDFDESGKGWGFWFGSADHGMSNIGNHGDGRESALEEELKRSMSLKLNDKDRPW
jgi:phosphatidylinositol glycan class N